MKECSILFVLHIETSHLIWTENQMTSFYMQCYNGLKWDNVLENSPQNAFSFHCLNKTKGITPLHSKTSTKKTIHRYNSNNHIKRFCEMNYLSIWPESIANGNFNFEKSNESNTLLRDYTPPFPLSYLHIIEKTNN